MEAWTLLCGSRWKKGVVSEGDEIRIIADIVFFVAFVSVNSDNDMILRRRNYWILNHKSNSKSNFIQKYVGNRVF